MKNISRAGWVIVGLVAALLLIPTMAVAATSAYNGIEGSKGNKANVTSGTAHPIRNIAVPTAAPE
jgi:hypothetical protein